TTATPSVPPNGNGWNNGDVTVTLSGAPTGGVQSIVYSLTGAQTGGATVAGNTASATVTAEGTTTLTYHATDLTGNVETDHTLVLKIDKTPPTLAPLSDVTVGATAGGGAIVTFTPVAADDRSGIVSTTSSPLS